MMKTKKNSTFNEPYTIKGVYRREDGFYEYFEETHCVPVIHGVNEKNNHQKAKESFIKKNGHLKNLQINSVIYQ